MSSHPHSVKACAAAPQPLNNFGQQWLTTSEAASYLRVQTRTLALWARQGKVRSYLLSGTLRQTRRFLITDLDAMLLAPSVAPTNGRIQ
jgi:excisionase family DNA binding protein